MPSQDHSADAAGIAGAAGATGAAWLPPETLTSLTELNELGLAVLAEQAAARTSQPSLLLRQIGELWRALDAPPRRRLPLPAARCGLRGPGALAGSARAGGPGARRGGWRAGRDGARGRLP